MEFRILGPLELHSSGEVVRIPGIRQRRLLALLLLNAGRATPVERLVDELWGDQPPSSVRQQVHNAIASLRGVLARAGGDSAIANTDTGYRLDLPDADSLDATRFRRLVSEGRQAEPARAVELYESALEIWRGSALAGLDGRLITSAAAALDDERLVAVEELMAQRLRAGEAGSVVGELRRLVADHPLRESLRATYMQALHRSGRRAEALAVYDEGRRLLAEELGLDPSDSLRRMHAVVLGDGAPAPKGGATPARPIPAGAPWSRSFLPHDVRDFTGRARELRRLADEAHGIVRTAVVISAIDGMGGVGKTTLAVHLAHQLAADFPDGQYFINLHGYSPGVDPVTPEQALDRLLRDAGVPPELIRHGGEGRSAQWRSLMAGQRALLLLDNATDAAHVRPLLPGTAGVLVLVTSRRKLSALEGAVPISLDVLPDGDAVALFAQIAGADRAAAEPDAVNEAVQLCGRLPLAIRIAAARLRDRAGWSVADLVQRLRDQDKRRQLLQAGDRSVQSVLAMSYRYLPPRRQRLFRLLDLHPGTTFDAHSAAACTGDPLEVAEVDLEALFDDNLLLQGAAGRFHFHDLVRDCAHQVMAENEDDAACSAARRRLFDMYLHTVHTLSRGLWNRVYPGAPRLDPPPPHSREVGSVQEALAVLAAEYHNLLAVARYTADHGWPNHAWQFACLLQPLLAIRNYPEGSYELFQGGLLAAREVGNAHGEAACLHGLAAVCCEHRTTAEARQHLEQALALSRSCGDRSRQAAQLVDLGNVYLQDDRLGAAAAAFQAAEALLEPDSGDTLRAAIDNNLGVVYRDLGRYDEALDRLHRALAATSDQLANAAGLTQWSIGAIHHARGEHDRALAVFRHIQRTSAERDFEHGEAVAMLGLGMVHHSRGDLDAALRECRKALTIARQLALHKLECEALIAIGEAAAHRDRRQAEQVYRLAAEQAVRIGVRRYQARVEEGLAHLAAADGRHADATRHWRRALRLYPKGMAHAEHPRRHLSDPGGTATCLRCRTTPGQDAVL